MEESEKANTAKRRVQRSLSNTVPIQAGKSK